MPDPSPLPAVIYAAKSTTDAHGSIPDQLADARALAQRSDWEVVGAYQDEGYSAFSGNRRDGLADAMAHAERLAAEAGGCALVVQHSDRLARVDGIAASHLVEHVLWARKANVRWASVQDPQTFDGMGLVYAALMGDRNHEDSTRKSMAVQGGMRRRAERGQFNGGPRPYGYQWEGPKAAQYLVIHEAEAVIVRRIYAEYVAGRSQKAIARDLTREGVPALRGGDWHQGTISRYLASELYHGRVRQNGETFEGEHEAIVPLSLWEEARALREASARTPGQGRGRSPKAAHLFVKGMLRCGRCGGSMVPRTNPRWLRRLPLLQPAARHGGVRSGAGQAGDH
jgi:site-specific DNA recombinase